MSLSRDSTTLSRYSTALSRYSTTLFRYSTALFRYSTALSRTPQLSLQIPQIPLGTPQDSLGTLQTPQGLSGGFVGFGSPPGTSGTSPLSSGRPKGPKTISYGLLGGPGGSWRLWAGSGGSDWFWLAPAAGLRNSGAAVAILALARKLGVDFGVDFSVPGCAGLDCSCGGNRRWW
jgi:hypothetical protein